MEIKLFLLVSCLFVLIAATIGQEAEAEACADAYPQCVSEQLMEEDEFQALKLLQKKSTPLHDTALLSAPTGPTSLDVAKGARVEVLWNNKWYRGVVSKVPDDTGKWRVKCDGESLLTPSSQIRPLPGSGLAAVIGAKVEAFYHGTWYAGFIHDLPSQTAEGTWKVQCDVDRDELLTRTKYIRPVNDEGATLARRLNLKPGGSVGVPGAAAQEEPLNWQIAHHIAHLRDFKAMRREVLGHSVKFEGVWPETSQLYSDLGFSGRAAAQMQIARYALVMRIWVLQALRGLNQGRLASELTTWFGDSSDSTRAYATLMATELYTAFNILKFSLTDDEHLFAKVTNEGDCTHPKFKDEDGAILVKLGSSFFKSASVDLDSFTESGTKGGTMMHELSHAIKDESIAIYKWWHWMGDSAGSRCADHGQVGTSDYSYGISKCQSLAKQSPRDARHNGDSVQYFIESSVLAERKGGFAVRVAMDGGVTTQ
eukprot:gb/GFBE01036508.1/.p1 GENE.gb/GFBE01036508.1/~~gb/GFBE01036508.1/.p1  ORF type:complete len:482 (+),score=98.59 gb/GFBE01036508.1/:1-1446(+)